MIEQANVLESKTVSVAHVSQAVGVSQEMVRRYIESGVLTSRRVGKRGWHRITYESFQELRALLGSKHER